MGPSEGEARFGFTGYKTETFKASVKSDYHNNEDPDEKLDFFTLFGVFFPAVTGIGNFSLFIQIKTKILKKKNHILKKLHFEKITF